MNLLKATYWIVGGLLFLLLALTACTENDVPENEAMAIRWDVVSEGMQDSRVLVGNKADLQTACTPGSGDEAIGIWSAYVLGGELTENVLGNPTGDVGLVYASSVSGNKAGGWVYGDRWAFWKEKAVYCFNAYFPQKDGLKDIANTLTSLQGTYDTETTQTDLMVARVEVDTNGADFQASPVALPMEHALATLKFIFLVDDGNSTDEFKLKSFSLDNTLKTKASLNYNTPTMSIANWSVATAGASGGARIHEWADNGGILFTSTIGASPYAQANGGHLFVIPQSCESAPAFNCTIDMDASYDVYYENISLGTTQFEPGKNYIYTIKVKENALNLNLSIKDWNELDTSYNIDF